MKERRATRPQEPGAPIPNEVVRGRTIEPQNTGGSEPGYVKKEERRAVGSVDDMLAVSLSELGYMHITFTVSDATVEWSSAQPVIKLSTFLRALEAERLQASVNGDGYSGLSVKRLQDILESGENESI